MTDREGRRDGKFGCTTKGYRGLTDEEILAFPVQVRFARVQVALSRVLHGSRQDLTQVQRLGVILDGEITMLESEHMMQRLLPRPSRGRQHRVTSSSSGGCI
ncbi:MAG: hypothetical protein HC923_04295 [Myxococcales bacterium]|nr:hypothetical protein [Myxococcales bacterium]